MNANAQYVPKPPPRSANRDWKSEVIRQYRLRQEEQLRQQQSLQADLGSASSACSSLSSSPLPECEEPSTDTGSPPVGTPPVTVEDSDKLTPEERAARLKELDEIVSSLENLTSCGQNYLQLELPKEADDSSESSTTESPRGATQGRVAALARHFSRLAERNRNKELSRRCQSEPDLSPRGVTLVYHVVDRRSFPLSGERSKSEEALLEETKGRRRVLFSCVPDAGRVQEERASRYSVGELKPQLPLPQQPKFPQSYVRTRARQSRGSLEELCGRAGVGRAAGGRSSSTPQLLLTSMASSALSSECGSLRLQPPITPL